LRLVLLFSAVFLFAVTFVTPAAQVQAAASLYLQQRCEPDGSVSLAFVWEGNDRQARQQWVDVSSTTDWQPGTFQAAGPLAGNVDVFIWPGWRPGTLYYARVNQQLSDGTWDPSITYRVDVQTCGGTPAPSLPPSLPAQLPAAPQQSLPPAPTPTPQPPAQQLQSASGATSVGSVTSPIGRGKDATFTVRTRPGTTCSATYTPPSGAASTADGLMLKNADSSGTVFWTWRIGTNTALGDGTVSATCGTETVSTKIVIIQ
jgi:hypothetical protein